MADHEDEFHDVDDGEVEDDILPPQPQEGELFTLPIMQLIKEAQQTHGLRHGDFQRYRQYTARRIRRIRKSLHFPQGTKHKVVPKKITENHLKDVRYLHLPLFDAERAWAYSMQLKTESNTELRKRYHLISRLRKAVAHADLLSNLCESEKCDARTKLEAQAYCSWMRGSLQFELENWKTAIELFTSAKTIYEKLSSAFVDEVKEIYLQRVEEITPNIRFCAYNIGDESAFDDLMQMRLKSGQDDGVTSRLDALIEKTRERQAATLSEVTWRGRTVPVRNEQVRVFLLSLQDTEKQLSEATEATQRQSIYDSLLKELVDAQQALKEELKDDPTFKAMTRGGTDYDGKAPNAVYLHTYLAYLRQTNTVERNLLMIQGLKENLPTNRTDETKKITKPQDLARLYDIIIQNLSEIPSLPGLDEDTNLEQEITVDILGYKAFKCYYMAKTYVNAKKYREGLALYERTLTYAEDALAGYKSLKGKSKEQTNLTDLVHVVDGEKYNCHAASILDEDEEDVTQQTANLKLKDKKLLADRLDSYYEDPALGHKKPPQLTNVFPPTFDPVPTKPLFFDLALSLVEFPSLDSRTQQRGQQGAGGGGLTGMVKGWLWGGGKK